VRSLSRRAFVGGLVGLGGSAAGLALVGCSFPFPQAKPTRLPRIGVLSSEFPDATWHGALWESIRTLGWTEGDNFAVDRRYAEERPERYAGLADDLVRLPVDVIVTEGTPMGLVAQQATSTIPIVLAGSGDPVGVGLVASIRRPGGNITGVSVRSPEGPSKNLELLKGVVPAMTRVGVLLNPDNPASKLAFATIEGAGTQLGVQAQALYVGAPDDLDEAFEQARRWSADALIVRGDFVFVSHAVRVTDLAARWQIPVMGSYRESVVAGSLMSYGASLSEIWSHAGPFVDRILRGAKPADMPVEQLDTPRLVVNLKTAKALGITIPPDVAIQVTEWIGAPGGAIETERR
jgi:putative ABC transport system substrate-binding protein